VSGAAIVLLIAGSAQGVAAYERGWIATGSMKPDWRGVLAAYTDHATDESCLVLVDAWGTAQFNVVPYYADAIDPGACFIDVRDPMIGSVARERPDLWWGIALPKADQGRLAETLRAAGWTTELRSLILLTHQPPSADPLGAAETMLGNLRPVVGSPDDADWLGITEGLANVLLVTGHDPAEVRPLLYRVEGPAGDQEVQFWGRAERCFARGDTDCVRRVTLFLIAAYPGSPEAYRLLVRFLEPTDPRLAGVYGEFATLLAQ
jgi:hypothetical protein